MNHHSIASAWKRNKGQGDKSKESTSNKSKQNWKLPCVLMHFQGTQDLQPDELKECRLSCDVLFLWAHEPCFVLCWITGIAEYDDCGSIAQEFRITGITEYAGCGSVAQEFRIVLGRVRRVRRVTLNLTKLPTPTVQAIANLIGEITIIAAELKITMRAKENIADFIRHSQLAKVSSDTYSRYGRVQLIAPNNLSSGLYAATATYPDHNLHKPH